MAGTGRTRRTTSDGGVGNLMKPCLLGALILLLPCACTPPLPPPAPPISVAPRIRSNVLLLCRPHPVAVRVRHRHCPDGSVRNVVEDADVPMMMGGETFGSLSPDHASFGVRGPTENLDKGKGHPARVSLEVTWRWDRVKRMYVGKHRRSPLPRAAEGERVVAAGEVVSRGGLEGAGRATANRTRRLCRPRRAGTLTA